MRVARIGVLNDRSDNEKRVALVPDTVRRLARGQLSVVVEAGAGEDAGYSDADYVEAGATLGARPDILGSTEIVLTVSAPLPEDFGRLRPGQVVIGILSPGTRPELVAALAEREVMAVSLDCAPRTVSRAQALDVLTSQSGVAGYKAALIAADTFGRYFPMMITAAGTSRPASVLVLGAGVAGLSAIGTARRLGAVVTGYDVRPETRSEVESLGAKFLALGAQVEGTGQGGYARSLTVEEQQAEQAELEQRLGHFDVVITTAQVPGRRPPTLVTKGGLANMRRGSVVVDMASGPLGGNVEGSSPASTVTTPTGVIVVGASDLPSRVPTAASDALSQNMAAALALLVKDQELTFDPDDEVQQAIVVVRPADRHGSGPDSPRASNLEGVTP